MVTVVLAAILLREPIRPTFLAGGALVLLGVYVGAFYRPARRRRGADAAKPAHETG
jgi:drug/metabolite transporter (DMT)-like permease